MMIIVDWKKTTGISMTEYTSIYIFNTTYYMIVYLLSHKEYFHRKSNVRNQMYIKKNDNTTANKILHTSTLSSTDPKYVRTYIHTYTATEVDNIG